MSQSPSQSVSVPSLSVVASVSGPRSSVPIEQSQALSRMRTGEDSHQLVSYPLPADGSNLEGAIFDGLTRSLLDLES